MGLIDIVLNNLWRRKSKMLLLFLGILLGVTTIVALTTLTRAMDHEISDKFDQIGANIVVVPGSNNLKLAHGDITINSGGETKGLTIEAIERILTIENNKEIAVIAPKLLEILDTDRGKVLGVGIEFEAELLMKKWWNLEGKVPQDQGEVILGSNAATSLNKGIGSIILIDDQELVVTGVLAEMGTEEDNGLYIDINYLQTLVGQGDKLSFIEISALCYTCPIEMIVHQISEKLPETRVTAILETVEARKVIIDRFNAMAQGVSVIVVFIGFLIITNTVMASINQRTREIGVLRALGYRRTHVILILFLEISLISSIGGMVGYGLGTLIAKWLAPTIAQMDIIIYGDLRLGLAVVALTIGVGILASVFPAFKAIGKDPAYSLNHF